MCISIISGRGKKTTSAMALMDWSVWRHWLCTYVDISRTPLPPGHPHGLWMFPNMTQITKTKYDLEVGGR